MNELQYNSTTRPVVNNLYALIYNDSLQVWDGSAFVAQSSTTASACCIVMALLSGSTVFYVANKPSGVGPGNYSVFYVDAAAPAFVPQVGLQYLAVVPIPPTPTAIAGYGLPAVTNISYTSVNNAGNQDITLPIVYITPRSRMEAQPSRGVYLKWLTTFKVDKPTWTAAAPSNTYPKPRDTLVVDGLTWTVYRDVDSPASLMPLWRLGCIRLEIKPELKTTAQYSQASCTSSSSTGTRTITYTNIGSPINAAIQPMTADLGDAFGTKDFEDAYVAYLETDPSAFGASVIGAGDLLIDPNGVKYEIIATMDRNVLDALPVFHLVKKL